ncbi:MAG: hypothetical protein MUE73_08090 [Planctomycetes bacterium]|jgi:hypothetical protein|nr:hypothetical protein [Planctomycetota bacterium]
MNRLLVAAVLFAAVAPARAADDILQLRSGTIVTGQIVAADDKGVTLRSPAGEAKYDWDALTPLCQYEVRSGRLDPGTADDRRALAEFCLRQGLYPYARREIATARGLSSKGDASTLDALAAEIDEAEADEALARIGQLTAEEEYDLALEEIRRFLIQAPPSEFTERARALVPDLLRRKDSRALAEAEEEKAREESGKAEAIAERVAKLLAEAGGSMAAAASSYAEALKCHELGNVTRARKGYLASEQSLLSAHATLRRLQRVARDGVAAEKAEKDKDAIRRKLVDVYLGLARLYLDDRNYKSGTLYVNKVLYLDPVNRQALDYRREIDANRIRRSAAKLTNSPGVITR